MKYLMAAMFLLASCTPAAAASFETCKNKLIKAAEAKIIRDISVQASGLQVIVDEYVWRQSTYSVKVGMARTIECWFFKGEDTGETVKLQFRSHLTNELLGEGYGERLEVK